jgi:hypothetical protein
MTEFPLYCIICEKVASHVYKGHSLCREHFIDAKAKSERAADMNDTKPGYLSDLFG